MRDYLSNKGDKPNHQRPPDLCAPNLQPITGYTAILDSEFTDQPKQNDKQYTLDRLTNTGMVAYVDIVHTPSVWKRHHLFFLVPQTSR